MNTPSRRVCGKWDRARAIGAALVLAAAPAAQAALFKPAAPKPAPADARKTPSGFEVPRYVSVKFNEVNARAGPGEDYRVLFTYRARGLPLQVIAEKDDWRRVCDPDGAVSWVRQSGIDNQRRTVMRVSDQPAAIRRRPDVRAPIAALLAGRAVASLGPCKDDWCQVTVGRIKGWAAVADVWGTDPAVQCRPRLARPPR